MNPIDISFTESVQGAGGAGFAAPIFRAGMPPSDFASSTPQGRAGMGADFLAGIDMQGLDPLSSMRDAFDEEVGKTYEWIAAVLEKGYDPRKMDMSKPESKQVYMDFMKQKRTLQKMADDLKLTKEMRGSGDFFMPSDADAKTAVTRGFKYDLDDMVAERNKKISASGIADEESYNLEVDRFEQFTNQLYGAYKRQRDLLDGDPAMQKLLDAKFAGTISSVQEPVFKGASDLAKAKLEIDRARLNLQVARLEAGIDDDAGLDVTNEFTRVYGADTKDGLEYYKATITAPPVKISSVRGYSLDGEDVNSRYLTDITIDGYEILPINSKGEPVIAGVTKKKTDDSLDIKGFKLFAVGSSKVEGGGSNPVWIDPKFTKNKHKGKMNKLVSEQIDIYSDAASKTKVTTANQQEQPAAQEEFDVLNWKKPQ
jgi:hypothetical protein